MVVFDLARMSEEQRRIALLLMKTHLLSDDEMYRKIGIDKETTYAILRSLRGKDGFSPDEWTDANPTCGYCHRMTAVAIQVFGRDMSLEPLQVRASAKNDKKGMNHFFLVLSEGAERFIIDLTRDQFDKERAASNVSSSSIFPYEHAKGLREKQIDDLTLDTTPAGRFVRRFMKIYEKQSKK